MGGVVVIIDDHAGTDLRIEPSEDEEGFHLVIDEGYRGDAGVATCITLTNTQTRDLAAYINHVLNNRKTEAPMSTDTSEPTERETLIEDLTMIAVGCDDIVVTVSVPLNVLDDEVRNAILESVEGIKAAQRELCRRLLDEAVTS
jgi:hypothetical protein